MWDVFVCLVGRQVVVLFDGFGCCKARRTRRGELDGDPVDAPVCCTAFTFDLHFSSLLDFHDTTCLRFPFLPFSCFFLFPKAFSFSLPHFTRFLFFLFPSRNETTTRWKKASIGFSRRLVNVFLVSNGLPRSEHVWLRKNCCFRAYIYETLFGT